MNQITSTYRQTNTNSPLVRAPIGFAFSGTDPRKGRRTPLDKNRYGEQRDEEAGLSYCVQHRSLCRFDSSGTDPRKGRRTPLNINRYSEQRDAETGLSYFGARYYDSDLLTGWLSSDPKADKYPNMSPYNYCAWTRPTGGDEHRWIKYNIVNNPVKLVDPDGRDWDPTTEEKYIKPYEAELTSRIDYFNSIDGRPLTEEEKSQFDECTASLNEISQLKDDPNTQYFGTF